MTDPDGFDDARRRDVTLRMAAVQGQHERERRIMGWTPLQIAEDDLARMIEFGRQFESDETSAPVTPANRQAMAELIAELQAHVDQLRGNSGA